jgi:hypothetical protein
MKVQQKVRIFLWRAIHIFWSDRSILNEHHISKESFYVDNGDGDCCLNVLMPEDSGKL